MVDKQIMSDLGEYTGIQGLSSTVSFHEILRVFFRTNSKKGNMAARRNYVVRLCV